MSRNVLLISVQTVKDRSGVHANVDDKLIGHEIKAAQDVHILTALGSDLFTQLQDAVEAAHTEDEEIPDGVLKTLLDDYVTDALVWYTVASLPITSSFQQYTKGVQQKTSDNALSPSMNDLRKLMDLYESRAAHYRERLVRYLKANESDYSEYYGDQSTDDGTEPSTGGISLPFWVPELDDNSCNDYP